MGCIIGSREVKYSHRLMIREYSNKFMFFIFLFFFTAVGKAGEEKTMDNSKTLWKISKNSVGPIKLGKMIPTKLLTREMEEQYVAGYYADGQPYEGFRFRDLGITVLLDRGPFLRQSRTSVADPAKKGLAAKALMTAKKGAKVKMIIVESKNVTTDAGVGVGSNLAALKSAYPDLKINPVPSSFGNDECAASSKSLPNVYFYFSTCKAADEGQTVTRIILF